MPSELDELRRRFEETGRLDDEVAWLAARLRAEPALRPTLKLAAHLGHAPARQALGDDDPPPTPRALIEGLPRWRTFPWARLAAAAVNELADVLERDCAREVPDAPGLCAAVDQHALAVDAGRAPPPFCGAEWRREEPERGTLRGLARATIPALESFRVEGSTRPFTVLLALVGPLVLDIAPAERGWRLERLGRLAAHDAPLVDRVLTAARRELVPWLLGLHDPVGERVQRRAAAPAAPPPPLAIPAAVKARAAAFADRLASPVLRARLELAAGLGDPPARLAVGAPPASGTAAEQLLSLLGRPDAPWARLAAAWNQEIAPRYARRAPGASHRALLPPFDPATLGVALDRHVVAEEAAAPGAPAAGDELRRVALTALPALAGPPFAHAPGEPTPWLTINAPGQGPRFVFGGAPAGMKVALCLVAPLVLDLGHLSSGGVAARETLLRAAVADRDDAALLLEVARREVVPWLVGAADPVRARLARRDLPGLPRHARLKTALVDAAVFVSEDVVVVSSVYERPLKAWRLVPRGAGEPPAKLVPHGTLRRFHSTGPSRIIGFDGWLLACVGAPTPLELVPEDDGLGARALRPLDAVDGRGAARLGDDGLLAPATCAFRHGVTRITGLPAAPRVEPLLYGDGDTRYDRVATAGRFVHAATPDGRLDTWLVDRPDRLLRRLDLGVAVHALLAVGGVLLVATADELRLLAVDDGALREIGRLDERATQLAASPDAGWLATTRGAGVSVWRAEDLPRATLDHHAELPGLGPLAFSPDSRLLLCGGGPDGATATIWELRPPGS